MSGTLEPRSDAAAPRRVLSTTDGIVLVVGLVLGAGIFRAPPLVAANVSSGAEFLGIWCVGGIIALSGALCYAELASAYPNAGGEYHVLQRAFGPFVAFLLGWSRLTVLQTGSIAILAFVFADYAVRLLDPAAAADALLVSLMAGGVVVILTLVNTLGLRQGRTAQYAFTSAVVAGLTLIVLGGANAAAPASLVPAAALGVVAPEPNLALALVFVLLTYGGWSEAAYLSAELRDERRGVSRTLIGGVAVVTAIFLLANGAYLAALGVGGVGASSAVAVDVARRVAGESGAAVVALTVMMSALSAANGTIITGARSGYAVGADVTSLGRLGVWTAQGRRDGGSPRRALLAQGAVTLLLVVVGAATRAGFETMVAYTAPVFWLTLLLMGAALFVLRQRDPQLVRPFRVPLYPVLPLFFCLTSAAMLWSSVAYAGRGALLGLGVMLLGVPLHRAARGRAVIRDS